MNDDFEKLLSDVRLNAPPAAWRSEIVGAALSAAGEERRSQAWWREWLWPCPQAWAGMAALWLIMVGFQFGSDGSNRSTGSDAGGLQASGSITAIAVLMDGELLGNDLSEFPPPQSTPAPPRKPPVQRPRSRRNSLEMGIA
jgi:hypothetical protein